MILPAATIANALALALDSGTTTTALWNRARRSVDSIPLRSPRLLGESVKTLKGEARGILTGIAYLLPGGNRCADATAECLASCLGHSAGRMIQSTVRASQRWKTRLLERDPVAFVALTVREIQRMERRAIRARMIPAVRIDGTSDTGIGQQLAPMLASIAPTVRLYDYTKNEGRALRAAVDRRRARRQRVRNPYSLTFSYSGANEAECRRVLSAGGPVAVVYSSRPGDPLPDRCPLFDVPVIDGDSHDARFLDRIPESGAVVGLAFKSGRGKRADAIDRAGRFLVHA